MTTLPTPILLNSHRRLGMSHYALILPVLFIGVGGLIGYVTGDITIPEFITGLGIAALLSLTFAVVRWLAIAIMSSGERRMIHRVFEDVWAEWEQLPSAAAWEDFISAEDERIQKMGSSSLYTIVLIFVLVNLGGVGFLLVRQISLVLMFTLPISIVAIGFMLFVNGRPRAEAQQRNQRRRDMPPPRVWLSRIALYHSDNGLIRLTPMVDLTFDVGGDGWGNLQFTVLRRAGMNYSSRVYKAKELVRVPPRDVGLARQLAQRYQDEGILRQRG
jgi:hypothetical protein